LVTGVQTCALPIYYRQMLIELVHIRRRELNFLRRKGEFSLEVIREKEWELDIEEARLKN